MKYLNLAKEAVKAHEGLRHKPYLCTKGKLTIGYGRNIEDNGITTHEANILLEHDLKMADIEARKFTKSFDELSDTRKSVIVNMVFNLGITRLSKFVKFKQALEQGNYEQASFEMLNSLWAVQVGLRANTLAEQMERG